MRHIKYADSDTYPVALLIKSTSFNETEVYNFYSEPLIRGGVTKEDIVAVTLEYNSSNKAPAALIKDYLAQLLPSLDSIGTTWLYCADANYFKALTKSSKAEPHLGYVLPCKIKDYEHMNVVLGINHKSLVYNPANEPKLEMSLETMVQAVTGTYQAPGENIIHYADYPEDPNDIAHWLNKLHDYPELSSDVETGSLDFDKAGVATITFCWSKHEGIAFPVDYVPFPDGPRDGLYGELIPNAHIRGLIKKFFQTYQGTIRWHNCTYDTKVLIYELFMQNLLDIRGTLRGLEVFHNRVHDTKIIAYLATNSTAGNTLSLKDLAHEFAGNYGMGDEIKDVRKIPLPDLLEYNLVDGLCTNFVFEKYYPKMVEDQQEELYYSLMMPSQKVITQVELSGMPLNPQRVQEARTELEAIKARHEQAFIDHPIIDQLEDQLTQEAWEKDYEDRKGKAKNPDKIFPKDRSTFPQKEFNPNSNPQLQKLFYDQMGLPIIDRTKSKAPSTGGDTIKKLVNHTTDQGYQEILKGLMAWSEAEKILSTFIPAFERAIDKGDGVVYLHGSFNLGGTVSGRLSSSNPNLQNIPSGSTYGKLIKSCFQAPEGFLFTGADFNSLEDYISALTTRDPAKMDVYLKGYDGHCLRAYSYFPERLPGIENTVESINSIKKKFPEIRQLSKTPTFALTYSGTYVTLMKNLGFDEATAKKIEKAYHDLYMVSDQWVRRKIDEASKDGYLTVAFGLRVRTPLLAKTYRGKSTTPHEAESEARTAGNALGQSWGLLNNRACNAFMQRVWSSQYKYDIRPVAMIHDSIYLVVKDDVDVVHWVNRNLIEEMQWQEAPEIYHETVKLGAELDVHYQSWAQPITIPNNASREEILNLCKEGVIAYEEKLQEVRAA